MTIINQKTIGYTPITNIRDVSISRKELAYLYRVNQIDVTHDNVSYTSCNNVAPVTNLCLGRATTRSHSSQWSKKKVAVET